MEQERSDEPQAPKRGSIKPWQAIAITFGGGFLLFALVHVFIDGDLFTFLATSSPFSDN
jgi:hypothetical protein